jgi:hypothetical protein
MINACNKVIATVHVYAQQLHSDRIAAGNLWGVYGTAGCDTENISLSCSRGFDTRKILPDFVDIRGKPRGSESQL